MGEGRKRTILGSAEGWYLDSVRVVLGVAIIAAALGVVVAAVWYATATLGSSPLNFGDRFVPPEWEDVRRAVLPLASPSRAEREDGERNDVRRDPDVDPRFVEIGDNLNRQFARNAGQETAFTDKHPRGVLEMWVDAGVRAEHREDFVAALIRVSRGIGEDPLINRIGSVPDRADTMRRALAAYRDEYVRRADTIRDEVAAANRVRSAERMESAADALTFGAGSIAATLLLVLVVVLMKIEVHLRRIAGPRTNP